MIFTPTLRWPAREDIGRIGLALAVAAGLTLRLWDLTAASQHTDEAYTFAMSALPLHSLVHAVAARDYHPPLFYLLTHYLMTWFPRPQWEYRYITAAFGCLTIVATWGAARRIGGGVVAAVAALAVALSPGLVQYDRIYRMYAVTVALSTLSWWLLLELEQALGRRRVWLAVAYAVTAVALSQIHYLGIVMLAVQAAYALSRRRALAPALAAYALAVAAYVPWLPLARQQLGLGGLALARPGLDLGLAQSIRGAFLPGMPAALTATGIALGVAAVVLAGGWIARRSALPFWLSAFGLQIALSIALSKNLAYFPRYLLIDVPAVSIAFGAIAGALALTPARAAAGALAAAGLALSALGTSNVLFDPFYQFPDWYALNAFMLPREQPSDAVVLDAGYEADVVAAYTAFRGREILRFMNPSDFDRILGWLAAHPRTRVWYVEHQNYYWDPRGRIAAALETSRPTLAARRWPRQARVDDVAVWLFGAMPVHGRS